MLSPAMVGFRCNDRDLSMPYVETGDELIPLLMLLSLAFAGPAASVSSEKLKGILCNTFKPSATLCMNIKGRKESTEAKHTRINLNTLLSCETLGYVSHVTPSM